MTFSNLIDKYARPNEAVTITLSGELDSAVVLVPTIDTGYSNTEAFNLSFKDSKMARLSDEVIVEKLASHFDIKLHILYGDDNFHYDFLDVDEI
ncbi:MAG: hypothetical protein LBF68_03815 [Christensenellaceae bacterium]|jgi:hypothetical protein|nr:hypothetical protein [Christensenellaceae bacterium]